MVSVCIFLLTVAIYYYIKTSTKKRVIISVYGSLLFSLLEAIHYKLFYGIWFTTIEQFVSNLLLLPLMIEDYHKHIKNIYLRVALFPINIWIFEIIVGYWLINFEGHNPAWNYNSSPYTFFDNQISLLCYHRWILLGMLQEIFYSCLMRCFK